MPERSGCCFAHFAVLAIVRSALFVTKRLDCAISMRADSGLTARSDRPALAELGAALRAPILLIVVRNG